MPILQGGLFRSSYARNKYFTKQRHLIYYSASTESVVMPPAPRVKWLAGALCGSLAWISVIRIKFEMTRLATRCFFFSFASSPEFAPWPRRINTTRQHCKHSWSCVAPRFCLEIFHRRFIIVSRRLFKRRR